MISLLAELNAIARDAFASAGLSPDYGRVQISDRPDLAQFQCNGALAAAKALHANPREIAARIVAHLKSPLLAAVDIQGPGFINLKLNDAAIEERLKRLLPTREALGPCGGRQMRHRGFRRAKCRQTYACRSSPFGHYRRLLAALVPRAGLESNERCASR